MFSRKPIRRRVPAEPGPAFLAFAEAALRDGHFDTRTFRKRPKPRVVRIYLAPGVHLDEMNEE